MTASSALVEFESQELCPNHKGEEIIAMEKDPDSSGELVFGCDKCVFERRLKDPVFLAYQARQTKQEIDARYKLLAENLSEVNRLQPDKVQQTIQNKVSHYFNQLHKHLKDIEKETLHQINTSQSLANIKSSIEQLHRKLNDKDFDRLETEKKTIDARVESQRYAFVARNKSHYASVQEELERLNTFLAENVRNCKKHMQMLYSDNYHKTDTHKALFELVQNHIHIDTEKVKTRQWQSRKNFSSVVEKVLQSEDMKGMQDFTPSVAIDDQDVEMADSVAQEQKPLVSDFNLLSAEKQPEPIQVESEPAASQSLIAQPDFSYKKSEYFFTHNKDKKTVHRHEFKTGKAHTVCKAPIMSPRLVYTPSGQLFVIGGTDHIDGKDVISGRCLRWDETSKKWVELATMLQPRHAYGCCVSDEFIYIAGGVTTENANLTSSGKDNRGKIHAVANCEAYDIKADRWIKLQDLPTPLFNLSLTVYNGSSLVAVGGTDGTKYTNSIMELKLDSPNNNWERLAVNLPQSVSNVGLWQQSQNKLIIFGGWDGKPLSTIYVFKDRQSGYDVSLSKLKMEMPDRFLQNGVLCEAGASEVILVGESHIHRLSEKNANVKWESEIDQ